MTGQRKSALDGTDLGDLLEDLTNGTNIHPGIRLIAAGIRAIADDHTLTIPATQLLLTQLCGSPDTDTIHAIAGLAEWLTSDNNPALTPLPADTRKTAQHQGELAAHALRDTELRDPAALACASLPAVHTAASGQCSECGGIFPDWNGGVCGACQAAGRN
jgi:hypothetical protein